jgi:hypothetical protein
MYSNTDIFGRELLSVIIIIIIIIFLCFVVVSPHHSQLPPLCRYSVTCTDFGRQELWILDEGVKSIHHPTNAIHWIHNNQSLIITRDRRLLGFCVAVSFTVVCVRMQLVAQASPHREKVCDERGH